MSGRIRCQQPTKEVPNSGRGEYFATTKAEIALFFTSSFSVKDRHVDIFGAPEVNPDGMPSSPAERDEYCEYFSGSGAITCRLLYRTEQLAFVQFRTVDWPGYKDFSNYTRVALFPEHLRPANPHSLGVTNFVQALAREVAAQQQFAECRHHGAPSGNGSGKGDTRDDQVPVHKPASAKGTRSNGAKPSPVKPQSSEPAKTPARQQKAQTNGGHSHSLKPVRSIAGLTIADFLYDR